PLLYLFLSHTPPLPSSTLFPYTTLFRSLAIEILVQLAAADVPPCVLEQRLEGRDGVGDELAHPWPIRCRNGAERLAQSRERAALDRKSTRLNSSHRTISYAVFCLKKKKV